MLGCEGASAVPERFADGIDSAFSLNGLKKNCADGIVEFRFQVRQVVEADKLHPGNDGSKGQAIFLCCRNADSAKRAPMKRVFQSEEAVFFRRRAGWLVRVAAKEPRQFHRAVDGFRP